MKEKNFFLNIKKQLPKGCFIQKIENKFNSGFPDLILITDKLPLFIELKSPIKRNRITIEKSQISIHLRIKLNNYISFILVRCPLTSDLFLFDGGIVCDFLVSDLCTFSLSDHATRKHGLLDYGSLEDCLFTANHKTMELSQRWGLRTFAILITERKKEQKKSKTKSLGL